MIHCEIPVYVKRLHKLDKLERHLQTDWDDVVVEDDVSEKLEDIVFRCKTNITAA